MDIQEEIDYARNEIYQIDAVINGLSDALQESQLLTVNKNKIAQLYKLHEQMEDIMNNIITK